MNNPYQNWTTEELKKHSELMWKVLSERQEESRQKKQRELNINGVTPQDIKVVIWGDGDALYYSFNIIHEGKDYDIYYDGVANYQEERTKENHWGYHSWWPVDPDEEFDEYSANGAFKFIPDGFSEAMENSYEFDGTKNQAIKRLHSVGITNIEEKKDEI